MNPDKGDKNSTLFCFFFGSDRRNMVCGTKFAESRTCLLTMDLCISGRSVPPSFSTLVRTSLGLYARI